MCYLFGMVLGRNGNYLDRKVVQGEEDNLLAIFPKLYVTISIKKLEYFSRYIWVDLIIFSAVNL